MSWRERLAARRADPVAKGPDGELPKLTQGGFVGFVSAQDGLIPANAPPDLRAHLLHLAESEGVDAAHVHRLQRDDVTACDGLDDAALRAYLHALVKAASMDAGMVPVDYSHAVQCDGCGPVWLWPEAPDRVTACPWCFRRKAGKRIPRPAVTCGECRHYLPDALNPEAGMGGCALGPARAYWPMRRHTCADMRPP